LTSKIGTYAENAAGTTSAIKRLKFRPKKPTTNPSQIHCLDINCGWWFSFSQWHQNEFESGGGGTDPARNVGKKLVVPLHFLALIAQLVVMVSAFVMVSTVWSVSCLLFFYSRCPRAQVFVKVGGTCPSCPMESASLLSVILPLGCFRFFCKFTIIAELKLKYNAQLE